jgi:hypothetical protein
MEVHLFLAFFSSSRLLAGVVHTSCRSFRFFYSISFCFIFRSDYDRHRLEGACAHGGGGRAAKIGSLENNGPKR